MKRFVFLLSLLLITPVWSGCHAPTTITTPAGKAAYSADAVALRVNELEHTAIAAEANGSLPTATARIIVQFCVSADKTLAAVPTGWQTTVAAAWASVKAQVPVPTNPAIAAAWSSVDVVLAAMGGN